MSATPDPHMPTVTALWEQLSLFSYPVLEAELLFGVCDSGSHWQYQWTLRDPVTNSLVAMLSSHSVPRPLALTTLSRAAEELVQVMLELAPSQ